MAIRVALRHSTRYLYDRYLQLSPQIVRLRPAAHCRTAIEAYTLRVTPTPHFVNWQQDPFGNYLARLVFPEAVKDFTVEVDLVADLVTINPFDFFLEPRAEHYPVEYEPTEQRDLLAYLVPVEAGPAFARLVEDVRLNHAKPKKRMVDVLVAINQLIQRSLRYDIRMEPGVYTPEEALERGHGSCRDFAWLLVNVLRSIGVAARFVSGYSIQLVADQAALDGPTGVTADCTDLHAWAEAYLPGAGWIGLDATSGLMCGEGHIPLACTAEPTGAAPITGSFEFTPRDDDDSVKCDFGVEMAVKRLEDRPRPTKSYTEAQWAGIVERGEQIDRVLVAHDVRLTLGGEPTFVSLEDNEAAEWTIAALGPTKAKLADQLIRRLHARFAPHALLAHGQGKWYPGEPLPRWAYTLYFRKDGEPVWNDLKLISDGSSCDHDALTAKRFASSIATRLGVNSDFILPAYEDVFYHLWRERRLPSNVDPFDSKLDDELERDRLRRVFEQGVNAVVGYALPLRARVTANDAFEWDSGNWFLRTERLYLLPGDSPMGYRLPLDSLPWATEEDLLNLTIPDPQSHFPALRAHVHLVQQQRQQPHALEQSSAPLRGTSAKDVVRTALCIEPRAGVLHVFLPPLDSLNAFLALVAQLEATARELGVAIRIEGSAPPYHPLLERLSVTPDPGVIEVNIHPTATWKESVERTTGLYEDARLTRLGTDKFMLDGRHTGTGGGNHVVLGGATAADSPFLRRPDLLVSLIGFFNNHPALSYVFSGLFVGPTSQAPRLDEARNDSLYELDIARQVLSAAGPNAPPWLVDRALRHLLTDVSGNTHRTAICIDKLYNPDTAAGRLGLVELRAFEMPPDPRLSCAQQLLVRAMVAAFWQQPYQRPLIRWGTTLHDRHALPHFLWADLLDAVSELSAAGVALDPNWYLPHWEFRFPRLGKISSQGIELELRQALEPWHVLGEEQSAGGTARYVDSSVERIQVLVNGLTDTRHIVAVAGRPLPLAPTGRSGEFVAAVRYKAWKPPSALHPTLDVDAPLVFDIYDNWSCRAIGGCTYHVSHPGGLSPADFPTNGLAAESRRMARFVPFGHSVGEFQLRASERSLEYPLTLDLRNHP